MAASGLWVKVMATVGRSLKTRKVAEDLGIPVPEVIGRLVLLWVQAVEFCPDGLITLADLSVSFCAGSDLTSGMAAKCLVEAGLPNKAGFLDPLDDPPGYDVLSVFRIHGWEEYSGAFSPSFKKRDEGEKKRREEKPAPTAAAVAADNALRAARNKSRLAKTADAPELLNGRGRNFRGIGEIFARYAGGGAGAHEGGAN